MFALRVQSLDGTCWRLPVGPQVAKVRAHIAKALAVPAFHEVRLVQGARELEDGAEIEVEVQTVVVPLPGKVLDEMERIGSIYRSPLKQVTRGDAAAVKKKMAEGRAALLAAAETLSAMEALTVAECAKISNILREDLLGQSFFPEDGFVVEVLAYLATAVGTCSTPGACIEILAEDYFHHHERPLLHTTAPLLWCNFADLFGHIASHLGVDALPTDLRMRLAAESTAMLSADEMYPIQLAMMASGLRALGTLGNRSHIPQIVEFISSGIAQEAGLFNEVAAALQQIHERQELQHVPIDVQEDGREHVDVAEAEACEEEELVDVAPTEAETDPLMLEQQDLHEALLRSKADAPMPIAYDDSVVIFRLTRTSQEAWRALSEAPALADARKRVDDAGCNIFPAVANGACLLVPLTEEQVLELQLQLTQYHIVALRTDRPAIMQAFKKVDRDIRPKLKEDHRAKILMEEDNVAGPARAPAVASCEVIEEVEVCHPRIREFLARNAGASEPSERTMSAPAGPADSMQPMNVRRFDLRH